MVTQTLLHFSSQPSRGRGFIADPDGSRGIGSGNPAFSQDSDEELGNRDMVTFIIKTGYI
jgi:hypothetical protein